jgi:cytochrome c peroxidase
MNITKPIYSFCFVGLIFSAPVSQAWAVCGLPPEQVQNYPAVGDRTLPFRPDQKFFRNSTGILGTFNLQGIPMEFNRFNDFFNSIKDNEGTGGNGRTCAHCHAPQNAWSISPNAIQAAFKKTQGKDPLFRPHDGANSPLANVATVAGRCAAYSMLLKYADIRITLPMPRNSTFMLTNIQDPYGYASIKQGLSLFRRPLPSTNLSFTNSVMWDGREAVIDATAGFVQHKSFGNQASHATEGHAEGPPLSDAQKFNIVNFETSLFTAQIKDSSVNRLDIRSAKGGPFNLADPMIAPTPPVVGTGGFNLFDGWKNLPPNSQVNRERLAIARGQEVFNSGNFGEFSPGGVPRHCTSCHSRINVGNSISQADGRPDMEIFFDVKVSDPNFIKSVNSTIAAELPKYTLEFTVGSAGPPLGSINVATGEACTTGRCKIVTTDPGRALITGLYSDINTFRVPVLRGLAGHPPYFHNGMAKSLSDVVNHYIKIFGVTVIDKPTPSVNPNELTRQEVNNLVKFLEAL